MTLVIPTAGLVMLLTPPTGVTADAGIVSVVADQSGRGHHCTQANADLRPFTTGGPLEFEYVWNQAINDRLAADRNLYLNRRSFSYFAVVASQVVRPAKWDLTNILQDGEIIFGAGSNDICFGNGASGGFITGPAFYRIGDGVAWQVSELKPLSSPHFVGVAGSADACTIYAGSESDALNTLAAGHAAGGFVGSHINDLPFHGRLYCLAIYDRAVSAGEAAAIRAAMEAAYSVPAAAGPRVVFDGDSITTGGWEGLNRNWVRQLTCLDGLEYANCAIAGGAISTFGNLNLLSTAAARVDSYLASSRRNILCFQAGTNDLLIGRTPEQAWADTQTYIAARLLAGWDAVLVGTCMSRESVEHGTIEQSVVDDFNTLLRNGLSGEGAIIMDIAADPDLCGEGAALDTAYFADGCHPTAAGSAKIAAIKNPLIQAAIDD